MRNTIFVTIALLLVMSLVITGCKKTAAPETPSQEPSQEGAEETNKDMSELESLDKDLNTDDLEGVEKDLEGIDW